MKREGRSWSGKLNMRRAGLALDLLLVFLFTGALIRPLFRAGYLERWESIESTFIADGRFLKDHWPHPQWQPLWYCGTRYDYLYPPLLRYGTALLAGGYLPVKAYHIYTGLLYCLGSAGVYLLVWVASRSRGAAWMAGAGSAILSPVFLVVPRRSSLLAPWRLWVMIADGEGPHIAAVSLVILALALAWLALERWRPASLAAAGVACAMVALTNFYGATSLAIFYPILVWSLWVTHRDRGIWLRAAAVPALAYGLGAFWLTPSYLRLTIENLQYVSSPGNARSFALLGVAVALFLVASWYWAGGRSSRAYPVFLAGSLLVFGLNVIGHFYFNFRVMGEPHRLIPELDLVMLLACTEILRRWWNWHLVARLAAAAVIVGALWTARHYVRHARELYPRTPDYRARVEYRIPEWMAGHLAEARTFVTGSSRLWWDTWHDLAQVDGGSDQGVLNPQVVHGHWEILLGTNPEMAVRWLTALGADAVIVPEKQSQEVFHDFRDHDKFAGVLPVLYDDGQGNVIYQVPRRYPSLARVVDRAQIRAVKPLEQTNLALLRAYTRVIEGGPDARTMTSWNGTDTLRVHARVEQGQSVLVQVTYDPAWHAYANHQPLRVERDAGANFSVIDVPPGEHDIRFVFETPLENRVGWLLAGLSGLAVVGLTVIGYRRDQAVDSVSGRLSRNVQA
jgi:hypothetical protein